MLTKIPFEKRLLPTTDHQVFIYCYFGYGLNIAELDNGYSSLKCPVNRTVDLCFSVLLDSGD